MSQNDDHTSNTPQKNVSIFTGSKTYPKVLLESQKRSGPVARNSRNYRKEEKELGNSWGTVVSILWDLLLQWWLLEVVWNIYRCIYVRRWVVHFHLFLSTESLSNHQPGWTQTTEYSPPSACSVNFSSIIAGITFPLPTSNSSSATHELFAPWLVRAYLFNPGGRFNSCQLVRETI